MVREITVVVSAKVSKKLKQEIEKADINISEAIRAGLENALREKKIRQLEESLQRLDLSRLTDQQIVRDIRMTRDREQTIRHRAKISQSKSMN